MSDDTFIYSSSNTGSSSDSDEKQNDTSIHTDTMTESDAVTVVQDKSANNSNNKKSFHPDNYEIIYEEAIKNEEFKSLFFRVMAGECSREPPEFLRLTDDYSTQYKTMRDRKEFQALFNTNTSTTNTTTTTSSSTSSTSNNVVNNLSPNQPSSLSGTTSSSNIGTIPIVDNMSINSAITGSSIVIDQNNNNTTNNNTAIIASTGIIIANNNNTQLPLDNLQIETTTERAQHPAEITTPTSPVIQGANQTNGKNKRDGNQSVGCFAPLLKSTLGSLSSACGPVNVTPLNSNTTSYSNLSRIVQDVSKLKNSAFLIFESFLKQNAKFQLNLGWNKAKILRHWEEICREYDSLIQKVEEVQDLVGLAQLIEMLHPSYLFHDVLEKVHQDIKMDQFPRFVRSSECRAFFKRKGEQFMRGMAIDISKGYKIDLRFKPQDLRKDIITDSDIYFGFTLAEDTPDWELFFNDAKTHCQCYLSKETYSFDQKGMKGMKLAKTVMLLPYDLEDCWAMFWHGDFHKIYDPLSFSENSVVHYSPPSEQQNEIAPSSNLFGRTYGRTIIDLSVPLLKKRVYDYIYSTIWDDGLEGFINVGKSVDRSIIAAHLSDEKNKEAEGFVDAPGLFYHIFMRTHEGKTRYCQMTYFDLGLPLNSDFIFKKIWKHRTKIYRDGFLSVLDSLTDKGKKKADHTRLVDSLYFKKPVDDTKKIQGYRSWYAEWEKMRKGNNSDVVTQSEPLILIQTVPADAQTSTSTEPESIRIILRQEENSQETSLIEQTLPENTQDNTDNNLIYLSNEEELIIQEDENTLQTKETTKTRDDPNPKL